MFPRKAIEFFQNLKVLEKGVNFVPIQKKINEPTLRRDFQEFCRRMRTKWNFQNKPSENFIEFPSFKVQSNWKSPGSFSKLSRGRSF